jgi:hypothetical protein
MATLAATKPKRKKQLMEIINFVSRVKIMHHMALQKFVTMKSGPIEFTIAADLSVGRMAW